MANLLISEGLARAAQVIMEDVSHGAVGTGTTDPTLLDSALETETNRVATTKTIRDSNIFQWRGFFINSNLPATLEEAGFFMNGSGAADSGELLCRSTLTFTKGTQDLLLVLELLVEEILTD